MHPLGLYHPGTSLVHRCPVGAKLLLLAVGVVAIMRWPWFGAPPTLLLYALARIPVRLLLAQLRPLWLLLLLTWGVQALTTGPEQAARVVVGLALSVLLAALATLTTRVSAMLDALVAGLGPLRRIGVNPDRVALLLALTIRCVPVISQIVVSVREAQTARGATRNPLALVVPVVIRTLRTADALGEALTARGADD